MIKIKSSNQKIKDFFSASSSKSTPAKKLAFMQRKLDQKETLSYSELIKMVDYKMKRKVSHSTG